MKKAIVIVLALVISVFAVASVASAEHGTIGGIGTNAVTGGR